MSKSKTTYRRADTGEYTTEEYAKKHPKTTIKETNKAASRKKPAKKNK